MTVRDLMRKLIEFNPDAEVEIVVNHHFKSTNFSTAFGAFEPEGTSKEQSKKVSIYLLEDHDSYTEDCCCDCSMEI